MIDVAGGVPPAQQRPGPKPRQHLRVPLRDLRVRMRSTKAGTEAPATLAYVADGMAEADAAQQRPGPKPRQHWRSAQRCSPCSRPLNKGRDRSPGNTR